MGISTEGREHKCSEKANKLIIVDAGEGCGTKEMSVPNNQAARLCYIADAHSCMMSGTLSHEHLGKNEPKSVKGDVFC